MLNFCNLKNKPVFLRSKSSIFQKILSTHLMPHTSLATYKHALGGSCSVRGRVGGGVAGVARVGEGWQLEAERRYVRRGGRQSGRAVRRARGRCAPAHWSKTASIPGPSAAVSPSAMTEVRKSALDSSPACSPRDVDQAVTTAPEAGPGAREGGRVSDVLSAAGSDHGQRGGRGGDCA